jgi:hypothetical protein
MGAPVFNSRHSCMGPGTFSAKVSGMNENETKSTEGVAPAPTHGKTDNKETWSWQIAAAIVLGVILLVLAVRILRRRPPTAQPLTGTEKVRGIGQ